MEVGGGGAIELQIVSTARSFQGAHFAVQAPASGHMGMQFANGIASKCGLLLLLLLLLLQQHQAVGL